MEIGKAATTTAATAWFRYIIQPQCISNFCKKFYKKLGKNEKRLSSHCSVLKALKIIYGRGKWGKADRRGKVAHTRNFFIKMFNGLVTPKFNEA